jgi:hypothetical protein
MPGQYPFSAYAAPTRKAPGFSQGYCSVAPGTASGHLKKGAGYWPCRVEISETGVTLATQARNQTIATAPAGSVSLSWIRRRGTGTVIMMDGRLWAIDFTRACQREQTLRGLPGLVQGVRRARIMNRAFASALQAANADAASTRDRRSRHSPEAVRTALIEGNNLPV